MIYFLLATLLWGTSFIAGKIAFQTVDPTLAVMFRLLISSVVLIPLTLSFFKKKIYRLSKRDFLLLTALGILTYPMTFMLEFSGLSLTSASSATTIIGLGPIMVALIGALFFKEKASPLVYLLGITSFIGVALMVGNADLESVSYLGCLFVFCSTIVVAFWVQLSKKALKKIPPLYYTPICIQLGTVFGLPVLSLFVKNWTILLSTEGVASIVYLAVFCSVLAGIFWNKGLEVTDPSKSGIFLSLEPVFGVIFAVVLLGEEISFLSAVGIALVIISAAVCMLLPQTTKESIEVEANFMEIENEKI
ncbi:Threonine/homoserine efflux transporter RhtA [Granulicatella balaenopterae]|uniref:Threonine/homoserine efflux transporter RhtA n=1 Tax=Granulicatella balaenopterae TaxID=137733 RepID=A0A1H9KYF3_9LACT|nr:DMT family transporter [Granulicatella balaenopterae]SER04271.1 Threonine/homoserine efflux transporter RhtA [Granulicatella balaenopterae]